MAAGIQKCKIKIVVSIIVLYLICGLANAVFHTLRTVTCALKLEGVYSCIKAFENNNARMPVDFAELTKSKDTIDLDEIHCVCDMAAGCNAYIYKPFVAGDDPSSSILLCDSQARHLTSTKTGFLKSMLFFYYGYDKVRNAIFHDGRSALITEEEFQQIESRRF